MKSMNYSLIITLLVAGFLLFYLPATSAEITSWNDVSLNYQTNTTNFHGAWTLDDTPYNAFLTTLQEATGWYFHTINVTIFYNTQALPYNLTYYNENYSGIIDWCELTTRLSTHTYSGNEANVTTTEETFLFTNGTNTGYLSYQLRHRDLLTADMICHYTSNENLYVENQLFGQFSTMLGSYECNKCDKTFEDATHELDNMDNITAQQLTIWNTTKQVIDWNYKFWLIGIWLIKIGLLILCFAIPFIMIKWMINQIKKLSGGNH